MDEFAEFANLKKKAKPKKVVAFPEEPVTSSHPSAEPIPAQAALEGEIRSKPAASDAPEAAATSIDDEFAGLKKKKKKALPADFDALTLDESKPAEEGMEEFEGLKKKKKSSTKKKAAFEAELEAAGGGEVAAVAEATPVARAETSGNTWEGTDRDYTYAELLSRVYTLLPDSGQKIRYTILPPQVAREGAKKTAFSNLGEIAKRMRREQLHITQFIYTELGTEGSFDGAQRLIMKGRFTQGQVEKVLKYYYKEYVICKTCGSSDTQLDKDNRLLYMICATCGSKRSVTVVKEGYKAAIGKRKKAVQ